jgi:signal transduction histidine kinase/ATP/maltotriose-dependent transcriptional regulator MalT
MNVRVIARKIREPELPYLHVSRQAINKLFQDFVQQNKKFIYLSGITGYGKTIAATDFLQSFPKPSRCWYSLDEWDKDPVTFLNYLYQIFLSLKLVSEDLKDLFSQPLNTEQHIKNFVGLLSNELEENLSETTFLVLDNFHEIQDDGLIQQIIVFLLNYCPEKLKIIFISRQPYPEIFYPFLMKHELAEISFKELMLSQEEAGDLLKVIGKNNQELGEQILHISQKNISLFILLAQNFHDRESLENYSENKLLKSALSQITSQIYDSFGSEIKSFINEILFLQKINQSELAQIFKTDCSYKINFLTENGILLLNQEENDYIFNPAFFPVLTEKFFDLTEEERDKILEKITDRLKDNPEDLLAVLFKARAFNKVIENLQQNYEHYFRNYLYNTLELLLEPLKKQFPDHVFVTFLQIRLLRSTGNVNKAIEVIGKLSRAEILPEIILEEGICLSMAGLYSKSIEKLAGLENTEQKSNLKISDYLTLINCLGIAYLNNHQLDLALSYFHKAINLKDRLIYSHDLVKAYHNLGLAYTWLGDFKKGLLAYEQAVSLSRELKILPLGLTFNNLAIIHNMQGDYNKAYQNCLSGLEVLDKINNDFARLSIYLTLSDTYIGLKNEFKTNESLDYVSTFLKKNPNPIYSALLYRQLARSAIAEEQPEKAREFIEKAMNTRKLSEGDSSYVEYKLETGIINYCSGYYREALEQLQSIEENLKQGRQNYHLARALLYIALASKALNDQAGFEKYYKLAAGIIKENQYSLLAQKLELKIDTVIVEEKKIPLKIYTFRHRLEVTYGDKEVPGKSWGGNQTKLIFLYLLLNKEGISKEKLYDIIFPYGDKNRAALHVILNKLKKALGSVYGDTEIIQYSDNIYRFNFSIDYWWDAAQFEYLLNEAAEEKDPFSKALRTAEALYLYKSHFMQGSELESWIYSNREQYRNLAYKAFTELANYYFEQKQFAELLNLSDHFFHIDNCNENACKFKIMALISLQRKNDALKQYAVLEKALHKNFNEEPSPEMKIFINQLVHQSDANIDEKEDLKRIAELFKTNEQLQKEIQEREKAMSDLKQAQIELVHTQKMAGLETLVAGVAHEINNPTNFVYGITHNLQNNISDLKNFIFELAGDEADDSFKKMFEEHFRKLENNLSDISEGSDRIKTIVKDLRSFSRLDEAERKSVEISECLLTTMRLVQARYNKKVEFITDFQVKMELDCLPAQLNQAFMNIMENSCLAIVDKQQQSGDDTPGKLNIKTFMTVGGKDFVTPVLVVEFTDEGCGMTEDVKDRIFEPFFTTRDVGSGTGMGMSITYSIIEKHQGNIEIKSEPGKGTTVTLYLPSGLL